MTNPTKKHRDAEHREFPSPTAKPPEETPAERVTRNAFNALSADEKRYVLAAKQDGVSYRGEPFVDFVRLVDEAERLSANPKWLEELKAGGVAKVMKGGKYHG